MENFTYNQLQSLTNSSWELPNPKQNVMGWEVKNEGGAYLGVITDLLYDTQVMTVRYLVIDLSENGMQLDDKKVMIPVGLANLHPSENEIILPNLHIDQFNALPSYRQENIGPEIEQQIRSIIGSPAALRLEETIAEYDQQQFYAHHHFDERKFYSRNSAEFVVNNTERAEQEHTIHDLIENSIQHDLHAAAPKIGPNRDQNDL
ncbi:MAG: PRC-barrel domain-containing protein [Bacteroidia bacterium]